MAMEDDFAEIRRSVRALCAGSPGEYWRVKDRKRAYPGEFVKALTEAGFLAALIPEKYGGSGLTLAKVFRFFWWTCASRRAAP
jgi:alkylation response protein AidB-like acyl-CoA dehydrogenase